MQQSKELFESNYSDSGFWSKVGKYAKVAGKEVIERALQLYYTAQKPDTPKWAKAVIYSTLGYFILPLDAIPDITPIVGYADDLGALAAAIGIVLVHIIPDVRQQAEDKVTEWFGE